MKHTHTDTHTHRPARSGSLIKKKQVDCIKTECRSSFRIYSTDFNPPARLHQCQCQCLVAVLEAAIRCPCSTSNITPVYPWCIVMEFSHPHSWGTSGWTGNLYEIQQLYLFLIYSPICCVHMWVCACTSILTRASIKPGGNVFLSG